MRLIFSTVGLAACLAHGNPTLPPGLALVNGWIVGTNHTDSIITVERDGVVPGTGTFYALTIEMETPANTGSILLNLHNPSKTETLSFAFGGGDTLHVAGPGGFPGDVAGLCAGHLALSAKIWHSARSGRLGLDLGIVAGGKTRHEALVFDVPLSFEGFETLDVHIGGDARVRASGLALRSMRQGSILMVR